MLTFEQIQEKLVKIDTIRKKINAYVVEAIKAGAGKDAIVLMAAISKDVATSGTDPSAILSTIDALTAINNDLNVAAAAVKAQEAE